jgi:hypothetical protein
VCVPCLLVCLLGVHAAFVSIMPASTSPYSCEKSSNVLYYGQEEAVVGLV